MQYAIKYTLAFRAFSSSENFDNCVMEVFSSHVRVTISPLTEVLCLKGMGALKTVHIHSHRARSVG